MSGLSGISNFIRAATAAAADKASEALAGILILPSVGITISEDTYTHYCGPARTPLIHDPTQIACRCRVFDAVQLTLLPKDSLAHHWNRMVMSAISVLDVAHDMIPAEAAKPLDMDAFTVPPGSDSNKGSIKLVPYFPPAEDKSPRIIRV